MAKNSYSNKNTRPDKQKGFVAGRTKFLIIGGLLVLVSGLVVLAASMSNNIFSDKNKADDANNIPTDSVDDQDRPAGPWTCGDTLIDERDSNEYSTVQIGGQCWMAENLNYGTLTSTANSQGKNCPSAAETKKYCYKNTESGCALDGGLYQWEQAMCGSDVPGAQGICPDGWHIPTDKEWKTLEAELGIAQDQIDDIRWRGVDEGGQLKGITVCGSYPCWDSPNAGATNSSGFTAWPAGFYTGSLFDPRGVSAVFWSSSKDDSRASIQAWVRSLGAGEGGVYRNTFGESYSFSVRCLQD